MKFRLIAAAGLVAAFVAPALAADEFYIAQDVKTKECTIVDKKMPAFDAMTASPVIQHERRNLLLCSGPGKMAIELSSRIRLPRVACLADRQLSSPGGLALPQEDSARVGR